MNQSSQYVQTDPMFILRVTDPISSLMPEVLAVSAMVSVDQSVHC